MRFLLRLGVLGVIASVVGMALRRWVSGSPEPEGWAPAGLSGSGAAGDVLIGSGPAAGRASGEAAGSSNGSVGAAAPAGRSDPKGRGPGSAGAGGDASGARDGGARDGDARDGGARDGDATGAGEGGAGDVAATGTAAGRPVRPAKRQGPETRPTGAGTGSSRPSPRPGGGTSTPAKAGRPAASPGGVRRASGGSERPPAQTPAAKRSDPAVPAWVPPDASGAAPTTHPVKAKVASRIYHLPGMSLYERTKPDRCYTSAEAAEADGFTRARR